MARKPTCHTARPANQYAMTGELIVEFSDGRSGGLISIWRNPETDRLSVQVYRQDDDVDVLAVPTRENRRVVPS